MWNRDLKDKNTKKQKGNYSGRGRGPVGVRGERGMKSEYDQSALNTCMTLS
jgi:hypothetical protein